MLVPVLLFILGLVLLIKGGDWFVDGSSDLARRFHVPELIIGATVVSIGTTLPEVLVSATGALSGHSEIAYGNAIGSIICNTALISAITFAIRPCTVDRRTFRTPVVFFFAAAVFYALNAYIDRYFTRLAGIALLLVFAFYIGYTVWSGKRHGFGKEDRAEDYKDSPLWKTMLMLVAGAAAIAVGARLLVDNGTKIAHAMGVPETAQGTQRLKPGQYRGREPVQPGAGFRSEHHPFPVCRTGDKHRVRGSGFPGRGHPRDVLRHGLYDPARAEA